MGSGGGRLDVEEVIRQPSFLSELCRVMRKSLGSRMRVAPSIGESVLTPCG